MSRSALFGLLLALAPMAPAAEDEVDPKAEADAVTKLAEAEAGHWKLSLEDGSVLTRQPRSILRWSNPNIGRVYGDVFLWTDRGCPAAVGSIYKWFAPYDDFTLEFKSLGRGRITGERHSQPVWQPAADDVAFAPLEPASKPAATAAERLRQMRTLAAEFHVSLRDTRLERERGTPQELRLLAKPVYRYDSQNPEVIDGAVFAFVVGTDPEALLLLEDRAVDQSSRWEFAFARLNNDRIEARRGENVVWEVSHIDALDAVTGPYLLMTVPRDE